MSDSRKIEAFVPGFVIIVGGSTLVIMVIAAVIALYKRNIGFALSLGLPSLYGLIAFGYQIKYINKWIQKYNSRL